jgi:hypothetical protein
MMNFVFLFFLLNLTVETILPLPGLYSFDWADSQLVVVSPHLLEAIESQGPVAFSIFIFLTLYLTPPNGGQMSSPTCSARSHCLSSIPSTADIIVRWLLRSFIKWQPPKTMDPPISHFFYGCHLGTPINLFRCSDPEPERLAPE